MILSYYSSLKIYTLLKYTSFVISIVSILIHKITYTHMHASFHFCATLYERLKICISDFWKVAPPYERQLEKISRGEPSNVYAEWLLA